MKYVLLVDDKYKLDRMTMHLRAELNGPVFGSIFVPERIFAG